MKTNKAKELYKNTYQYSLPYTEKDVEDIFQQGYDQAINDILDNLTSVEVDGVIEAGITKQRILNIIKNQ